MTLILTPRRFRPHRPSQLPLQPMPPKTHVGGAAPPASPSLCRCAKLLLRHGAIVNLPSEDGEETALHVAAKHCLCDHARLYLRHGARVDARSAQEDTALGVLCGQAPGAGEGCLQLCRLLAAHGADIDARDEMRRSPLHKACGAANAGLARFLLRCGADVNAIDYDGVSPLGCVLQNAAFKKELRPHLTVQLLLNHGSQKIWPPAFVKVPTPKPLPYIPWHPGFCNWGWGALGNKKLGVGREFGRASRSGKGEGTMASGLAMLLGMMETKTPVLWQWGKAGRVKGRMEPAWAGGSGKFPAWGSQRQAWYISHQCSCLMALRFIDFTSNNKENIILDYHTQAKNVNKKQGPHPEEEVPQRGRSSHCFTDGERSPRQARTNPTPASY